MTENQGVGMGEKEKVAQEGGDGVWCRVGHPHKEPCPTCTEDFRRARWGSPEAEKCTREANRADTLRYTYGLLRKLEAGGEYGGSKCPICLARDEAVEGAPEIEHSPGCEMKSVLARWASWFSEAERALTSMKDLWGREVLVETTEAQDLRQRETAVEDQARLNRLGAQMRWNDLGNWKDPCTPPAPPDTASAAEETSSSGERCGVDTAGGASGWCCEEMEEAVSRRYIWSQSGLGTFVSPRTRHDGSGSTPVSSKRISFCPWCGEKLGGEG